MASAHISVLETLGIFGIHADYMAQFRDFLTEEKLPTNEEREEFLLPVIKNLGTQKLRTIRLKKTINGVSTEFGDAFRKLGGDRIESGASQEIFTILASHRLTVPTEKVYD
jgi:hypothetical protein